MVTVKDAGSSASTTPGTKVAEITASSGNKLVQWAINTGDQGSPNTAHRLIITYTDDTTTTIDSDAGSTSSLYGNAGGVIKRNSNALQAAITTLSAKDVKNIRVETLNVGNGVRYATLAATEVATTDTKRAAGTSASATAGTVVATLSADSGKSLIGWTAVAGHTTTASTRVRLRITYQDATTSTIDTASNSAIIFSNAGGSIRVATSGVNFGVAGANKEVATVEITTLNTGTGTRVGVIAGEQETTGTSTRKISGGSSNSSTSGTTVAEVEAASGNYLYAINYAGGHINTASTEITATVTYTDNTTSTIKTEGGFNSLLYGDSGGVIRRSTNSPELIEILQNKQIKKMMFRTSAVGTGVRYGAISALEATPPAPPPTSYVPKIIFM